MTPHRATLVAATAMTTLLIILGGVVCVTESARGCPDWPRCYGQLVPPLRIDAIIEYSHRLIAALTTPVILTAAIMGARSRRSPWWSRRPTLMAVPLLAAVVIFGAVAVLRGLPTWAAVLDVGSALLVLALLVTASVGAVRSAHLDFTDRWSWQGRLARWTAVGAGGLFLVLVSGVVVAAPGSSVRCLGCLVAPAEQAAGLRGVAQIARLLLAGSTGAVIAAVVSRVLAAERDPACRVAATAAGALLVGLALTSVAVVLVGSTTLLRVASVVTVVGLWVSVVSLTALTALRRTAASR